MEVKRTFDLLNWSLEKFDKEISLAGKENGKWVTYSQYEFRKITTNFSYGLLALGLKPGDRVALVSNNRPEWNFIDMGISQAGMIHVPIYPTITAEEYEYILNDSKPRRILVSDKTLYAKIKPLAENESAIEEIYTINKVEGAKNWEEIVELG